MISVHDLVHSKNIVETPAMYVLLEMQNIILGLEDEIGQLRKALGLMIYETTHLSAAESNGSHWCKISGEALALARKAIEAEGPLK